MGEGGIITTHILLFEARTYIDVGIDLLNAGHWQTQYSLSLQLFEMSASVSWAQGELPKMAQPLAEILSNATEFDDTLVASSLAVKMLTASSKYDKAMEKCCRVLEKLGEALPSEYDVSFVLSELSLLSKSLQNMTATQMKQLPPMSDKNKLGAMKFLNLLGKCVVHSRPVLLHVVSCRMVKLTLLHGFCNDSIVGLGTIGLTIVSIRYVEYSLYKFLQNDSNFSYRTSPPCIILHPLGSSTILIISISLLTLAKLQSL